MNSNQTTGQRTLHPVFPMALGALLGGVLLMAGFISVSGEDPWEAVILNEWDANDFESYRRSELRKSLLLAACIGGLCGTTIGGALWVTLTKRPVSSILVVVAWWLLGVIGGLILSVGVLNLPFMAEHLHVGRDGSGGPGVFLVLVVVGMSGVVAGSVFGICVGVRRAKSAGKD